MPFTLDKLARALKGMPRDAEILIELPDGSLADIDLVKPGYLGTRSGGRVKQESPHGAVYGIVLLPKIP